MKKLIVFIILVAVGYGVWHFYLRKPSGNGSEEAMADIPKSVEVERGDIDLRVSTTGRVVSNLDVEIKSKASGTIIKLPFDISDKVTSGQLLTELDPVDELRNVALREISLQSAQARLFQAMEQYTISQIDMDTVTSSVQAELNVAGIKYRDAQARLVRGEDLFTKQLISREDLDAARSNAATAANSLRQAEVRIAETKRLPHTLASRKKDIDLSEAEVKRAQVDLDNVKQRLKETKIYAPIDGIVTDRKVQIGQIIASGISNVGGGTALMILSDTSRMFVSATVDESDIGKVDVGQMAIITTDAHIGKRFRGKIVRVAAQGVNNSNVVTFEVKIEVASRNKDLLKPEMTANVEIEADRSEDALVLPNETIQYSREGYYVEVPDGAEATKRQMVLTGLTDGINTEITSGVVEGQEVLVPELIRSRWSQEGGGPGGRGGNFNRGIRRMGYRMSRSMRGGGRRR